MSRTTLSSLVKFIKKLALKWAEQPFPWECVGWLIACKMGFTVNALHRFPEIGWLVKMLLGLALLNSKRKDEKLLGQWLLLVTEVPPVKEEEVFVGGHLAPCVVALYRRSWMHPPIKRKFNELMQRLLSK